MNIAIRRRKRTLSPWLYAGLIYSLALLLALMGKTVRASSADAQASNDQGIPGISTTR